ncbi:hypothetical protein DERF_009955 [Dermatophagoides farinae]|uniref:Uncharacterized protein n=1 Tax=Dermatophagoides farinae TaxID=6954 RepID=A0A922HW04_DERFA|nr:hypothetical protein DERF_009955 [Dermatophagoides farinae]
MIATIQEIFEWSGNWIYLGIFLTGIWVLQEKLDFKILQVEFQKNLFIFFASPIEDFKFLEKRFEIFLK